MLHAACEQLEELRRRDRRLKVFGASEHRYRSTPASASEVARLEGRLGVSLPWEYREFLLDVGYGAGPYYGIWSPDESLSEIQDLAQDYGAEEGKTVDPAAAFPLGADDLLAIEAKLAAGDKSPAAECDWPCGGCLPIGHQGCTFWSVLVLSGEFAGSVWDMANFGGYAGQWMPASRPPGWWEFGRPHPRPLPRLPSPPTFGEWFAGWVARCLADLPAHA